jgi:RES domain-containing protein
VLERTHEPELGFFPLIENVPLNRLAAEWRVEPPPPSTKVVGDAWVREKRSAVLALPSVIIPGELNYLFNPAYPAFKRIAIGKPERFAFDPRLLI